MKQLIFLSLLITLFSTGCKEDVDGPGSANPDPTTSNFSNPFLSGNNVNADFKGRITDQNGNPVANAFVNIGSKFSTTNEYGFYKISNVSVDASFALIKVLAGDHFDQFRNLKPQVSKDNIVDIQMIPRMYNQFFEATDGGTIQIANGGSVVFEPSSIVDENGNAYTGQVSIASTYLDPTDMALPSYMPGSIAAVDAEGNGVAMITYGMIGVEMVGSNGRPLQIAPDRKAQISFPVADAQIGHAPDAIPLWYFNESAGIWHEETSATRNGNTYNAEVSHFSFWNCDIPVDYTTLEGTINCEVHSNVNLYINLERPDGSSATGYTDVNGFFSGIIPASEVLIMEVYSYACGFETSLYTTTIGPFSSPTDLGSFDIECTPPYETPLLTGSVVDCDGTPMEGIAVMFEGANLSNAYALTSADGTFDYAAYCFEAGTINYTLVDFDNLLQGISDEVTVDTEVSTEYDLGALAFCETTALVNHMTYEEGDYEFVYPFTQITDTNSCTTFHAYLNPLSFEDDMMTLIFETLDEPGPADFCLQGSYVTRNLPDGAYYMGYMNSYDVIITDINFSSGVYTLISGTYSANVNVTIFNGNNPTEDYTATASGSFHFEP